MDSASRIRALREIGIELEFTGGLFKTQNPTGIQIFTSEIFGEIRTCQVNNQIMFVGKDVATALGYKNPSNALQVHVDSEDKTSYLIQVSGSNYKANTLFVNESGLYSLVLSSKLPQAKAFKRWVTCEVLPQIRMTGGYIPTKDANGNMLSEEEIVERAHEIVGRTHGVGSTSPAKNH